MKHAAEGSFLREMARASAARAARLTGQAMEFQHRVSDLPGTLTPQRTGFDVIAEVKLHSPSEGKLTTDETDDLPGRVRAYADGGALAISVLTEPTSFGGSVEHLRCAALQAHALGLPVLRKDFPVRPLQLAEARAYGADGVLLIARILDDPLLEDMLAQAEELDLFVLLEAFDAADLQRMARFLVDPEVHLGGRGSDKLMVGVNARDLTSLRVDPRRQARLAGQIPGSTIRVAESGILTPEDAAQAARVGYHVALVGTALMRASDPTRRLREFLVAGRAAHAGSRHPRELR